VTWKEEGGGPIEFVDVPGTYSLSARSPEEQNRIGAILATDGIPPRCSPWSSSTPDSSSETLSGTADRRAPCTMVLAINMIDEARVLLPSTGHRSSVRCSLRSHQRAPGWFDHSARHRNSLNHPRVPRIEVRYPAELSVTRTGRPDALPESWRSSVTGSHAPRVGALELARTMSHEVPPAAGDSVASKSTPTPENGYRPAIISSRYQLLDAVPALTGGGAHGAQRKLTDRVDAVLLHRVRFPRVPGHMLVVFQALFSWPTGDRRIRVAGGRHSERTTGAA